MKQYTHAWLAFKAIQRLQETTLTAKNRKYANNLVTWFHGYRDDVIQGAWYPDAVIKDMASSHILKITPSTTSTNTFKRMPSTQQSYQLTRNMPLKQQSFEVNRNHNLPDRCESLAHSIIDHLKMLMVEDKGSPVSPSNNQLALILFMLSHYIADAHMPLHCDARNFGADWNLHEHIEKMWDNEVRQFYSIDEDNKRFFYNKQGYPLNEKRNTPDFQDSILGNVEVGLQSRPFQIGYGSKNKNVWDFMSSVCQHSYLLSHLFIPLPHQQSNTTDVTRQNWENLGQITFKEYSIAVLTDTVDSIARIWLRVWRRYMDWLKKCNSRKKNRNENYG